LLDEFNAVPIFLPEDLAQKHYNGFSNSILWPCMPEKSSSNRDWCHAYQEVNEIFADNILPWVEDNDMIWVHDYHLMLLPGILRERLNKKKNLKIGFFLHTPFPTEDHFTILPSYHSGKRFVRAYSYVTWSDPIRINTPRTSWTAHESSSQEFLDHREICTGKVVKSLCMASLLASKQTNGGRSFLRKPRRQNSLLCKRIQRSKDHAWG